MSTHQSAASQLPTVEQPTQVPSQLLVVQELDLNAAVAGAEMVT